MRALFTVSLLGLLLPASSLQAREPVPATGTITGTVHFTGKAPPVQKILTTEGTTLLHRDLIVDNKTKGLRDVVVGLVDVAAQPKLKKAEPITVDQKDMVYLPRVVALQHGQPVRFDNSDSSNHSVTAASTLAANQLNLFVLPGRPIEHTFEPQKHPVLIGCSLHAWMRAWIYVFPHPWFAQTDAQGRFRIDNVPPGTYTLLFRHADGERQERKEVTVEAGKSVAVDLEWK